MPYGTWASTPPNIGTLAMRYGGDLTIDLDLEAPLSGCARTRRAHADAGAAVLTLTSHPPVYEALDNMRETRSHPALVTSGGALVRLITHH